MSDEYDVGFGKPPHETRYISERAGNKKGRPKGSKNEKTLVREFANEVVKVKENGKHVKYTTVEFVLIALRNLAAEGNVRASKLREKTEARLRPEPVEPGGLLLAPETLSEEQWIRRVTIENRNKTPPPGYKDKFDDDEDEQSDNKTVH